MDTNKPSEQNTELRPLSLEGVIPFPEEASTRYREVGYWIGQTHTDLLNQSAATFGSKTAVLTNTRSLTYQDLSDRSRRYGRVFAAHGIRRGDRVVVHFPNITEFFEVTFGLFFIGAVPIFTLAAHRSTEITHFCQHANARAYITTGKVGTTDFPEISKEVSFVCPDVDVYSVPEDDPEWLPRAERELALDASTVVSSHGDAQPTAIESDSGATPPTGSTLPSDIAFLQLSGGTTGQPKMIPRTHDDYLYSVRESVSICDVREGDVMLAALPISHNFTMSSPGALGAFFAGATVVLAGDPSPSTCFPLIERYGVTQAPLVPPLLLAWLNSSERREHNLGSLRTLWVGGAKLSSVVARRVKPELGCTLQQVFGMAEGLVNYTRLDDDEEITVSCQGHPISPDDEIRVVDDEDNDVAVGEPGNLLTRGPYTIRGYYRAPEHNARSFTDDGFYRTGDIVIVDHAGNLTVVGRSKDLINRGGEKIAPEEVENQLLAHDAIHDVSVVGLPDDVLGERTRAYVILKPDYQDVSPTPWSLKRFLRTRNVAGFTIPDDIKFVPEFPHTGVGKVSKKDQR